MKVEMKKFYKDFERKRITEIEKEKKRLLASLQSNPTQKKAIADRINEIADIQLKDNYVKSSVNKLLYGEVPSKLLTATLKKPFVLETDASGVGAGATLLQDSKVISWFSKKFNDNEKRILTACEKECYAIVLALKHFHYIVASSPITVITDNNALLALKDGKINNSRLLKWKLTLADYQITLVHKPGKLNVVPDALSRGNYGTMSLNNLSVSNVVFKNSSVLYKNDQLAEKVADTSLKVSQEFKEKLEKFQSQDPELNSMAEYLKTSKLPSPSINQKNVILMSYFYVVVDNILYRVQPQRNSNINAPSSYILLIAVPRAMVDSV
ncbi:polyprotein [Tieghemostelium lacteum]|uniref:Polyprotein n=1 Tax=Tieghemostelium lacteum TaxID=361077 RepID=A0A151ZGJ7_TIELA|nr:polyprotein [Tieghemostelium lacteum]|eukprot:KYQ93000.1 polyprotein [Tieghemostelium lacteum]